MTTINPATSTPAATATTATSAASSATSQLSGNFNTFLTLLTTQLQNQDPLSPMDSSQFTQQLVEFSQVEQQINTNSNLQSLITLSQNQSNAYAMNYLGKDVVLSNGEGALTNGSADWTYGLDNASTSTQLTVTDSSGKVVYTAPGETTAGTHDFSWDGTDNAGSQLPDGAYTLSVNTSNSDGSSVTTSVASKGTVSGIDFSGSVPQLVIGSIEIPVAQASLIADN
jgi:flagellar basal-body rod modification protein FlgD